MSTTLYFGEDSDSESYDLNDSTLPFPKPLDRSAFLDTNFSASDFLANLQNRFQTLDDLQSELQALLKSLNKELVDLVNDNYTDFLSLGDKLRGGEERIEEIRVGLLGFQRDVTGVRDLIAQRSSDVKLLLEVKASIRKEIRTGRTLLEIDERLDMLESQLGLKSEDEAVKVSLTKTGTGDGDEPELLDHFSDWDDSWTRDEFDDNESNGSDDESIGTGEPQSLPSRLSRHLTTLHIVHLLSQKCGASHPFIVAQEDRIVAIKGVLRQVLEAEIRNQPVVQAKQRLIKLRTELDD